MLPPISPRANQVINKLIQDQNGQLSTFPFPPNIAGAIPPQMRKDIFQWMLTNYIWPQVQERKGYEHKWDKLLMMARAAWKMYSTNDKEDSRLRRSQMEKKLDSPVDAEGEDFVSLNDRASISDTIIFDAVDRLTNLNHFIAFKEKLPVRYEIPDDMIFPNENDTYSPMSGLIKSANAWLNFNSQQMEVYRKGWMASRHHYTYGVSFCDSQFVQKIQPVPRRQLDKSFKEMLELTEIGITFDPISIRKLWLNPRVSAYKMNHQPCPFFFEEIPRFAIVANVYEPETNPFGFGNTDTLSKATYLFGSEELNAVFTAQQIQGMPTPLQMMKPEFNTELMWSFYAMLPIAQDEAAITEDNPMGFVFDKDGKEGIPLTRWIVKTFGNNLCNGAQDIITLQRNFYPHDDIPLYGSAHMPTLDDGAYSMSIGEVLEGHYTQLCKCMLQYIENKDWINDPPTQIQIASPAMAKDINKKGSKIPVNGMNDIQTRTPFDATGTTPTVYEMLRQSAQTSSKAVDAILGKAMGSRTSATEASNIFQTAMSGVTTDINLFCFDIYGNYATRVWEYTGYWVDPDVLKAVTGSYGFQILPEHMALRLGLKWDTGSSFIESLTRQSNYRYILESSQPGDPSVNRPYLLKELLREWKMKNVDTIINDGGLTNGIQLASEQAMQTYLGMLVLIDPDQDHALAIKIKKSYLQDRDSVWNKTPQYVANAPKLVEQIQQHYYFQQMQMLQMQAQMQQQMIMNDPSVLQPLQTPESPGRATMTGGQAAQQKGGTV